MSDDKKIENYWTEVQMWGRYAHLSVRTAFVCPTLAGCAVGCLRLFKTPLSGQSLEQKPYDPHLTGSYGTKADATFEFVLSSLLELTAVTT